MIFSMDGSELRVVRDLLHRPCHDRDFRPQPEAEPVLVLNHVNLLVLGQIVVLGRYVAPELVRIVAIQHAPKHREPVPEVVLEGFVGRCVDGQEEVDPVEGGDVGGVARPRVVRDFRLPPRLREDHGVQLPVQVVLVHVIQPFQPRMDRQNQQQGKVEQ
jgi:hypothetical protein